MAVSVFNKFITIKYDTVNYPADTTHILIRTFNDAVLDKDGVPDPTQIIVSFNGQHILRHTTETVATFARYYYELIMTETDFTISVIANSSYTIPHYLNPTPLILQIYPLDIFFVDYTYTVTI